MVWRQWHAVLCRSTEHRARTDTGSSCPFYSQCRLCPSLAHPRAVCCANVAILLLFRCWARRVQLKWWPREPRDWIFPPCMCRELFESILLPASQFGKSKKGGHQVFGDMSFLRNVRNPGLLLAAPCRCEVQSQHWHVTLALFDCIIYSVVWLEVPLYCAAEQILYFVIDQQQVKHCFSEPSNVFVFLCSSVLVLSTLCVEHWKNGNIFALLDSYLEILLYAFICIKS